MSRLAVHSKASRQFNVVERRLRGSIQTRFNVHVIATGTDNTPIDALWVRRGVCVGCSEHKVRRWSRLQMQSYGDTYLITAQKLVDGQRISRALGVPFYVVVALIPDAMAYAWRLTDHAGEPQFTWEEHVSTTQSTVEGGTASRINAYLPFTYATMFTVRGIAPRVA